MKQSHNSRFGIAAGALIVIVVAAISFWAGRATLIPPETAGQVAKEGSVVDVVEQELERVLTLTTTVTRPSRPLGQNFLSGVATHIAGDGQFEQGDLIYKVGETGVFLAEGKIPFWRNLSPGTRGEDVKQLQRMLRALKLDVEESGLWDAATTKAVQRWQRDSGIPLRDQIELGELVAAPSVPINISFEPQYSTPGIQLSGGETVLLAAAGEPEFVMEVTEGQAEMIPSGTAVEIRDNDQTWQGVTTDVSQNDDGLFAITVAGPDGGSVCSDTCDLLPAGEVNHLKTDIEIVAPVAGPVVPVSAIHTGPGGLTTVSVVSGRPGDADHSATEAREISIVTVVDGLASVTGVEPGEKIKVFADNAEDA